MRIPFPLGFREDGKGKAAKGPPPSYGKGWGKGREEYGSSGAGIVKKKIWAWQSAFEFVMALELAQLTQLSIPCPKKEGVTSYKAFISSIRPYQILISWEA